MTASNWCVMAITWVRFNRAMRVQGIDRNDFLPAPSRFQPYAGYWVLFWAGLFPWVQGYAVFLNGNWGGKSRVEAGSLRICETSSLTMTGPRDSVATFIFNYGIEIPSSGARMLDDED